MNKQKIKRLNLKNTQEIKEFSEISTQELIKIYKEFMKYKTGKIQKWILTVLLNHERRHNKMMWFDDLCTATKCKPELTNFLVRRLKTLLNKKLITHYFDDKEASGHDLRLCGFYGFYKFGLTIKGKRFVDLTRGMPNQIGVK